MILPAVTTETEKPTESCITKRGEKHISELNTFVIYVKLIIVQIPEQWPLCVEKANENVKKKMKLLLSGNMVSTFIGHAVVQCVCPISLLYSLREAGK